ncbi:hypothetical protein B5X24_HaOG214635 [Helicoverpa armigera]|nr:hypothetical protein B5X24_HaOG214635 [Helicoverpa armigera]
MCSVRWLLRGLHTKAADPAAQPGGTTAAACGVLVIVKYSMKAGGMNVQNTAGGLGRRAVPPASAALVCRHLNIHYT